MDIQKHRQGGGVLYGHFGDFLVLPRYADICRDCQHCCMNVTREDTVPAEELASKQLGYMPLMCKFLPDTQ